MGDGPDVGSAANQIFVLSFDLAGAEFSRLPDQIASTLASAPVQDAIRKTLLDFLKTKMPTNDSVVSGDDAKKLAESLEKSAADPATKQFLDKIKATPEYKQLSTAIDAFEKAAKSSSLGVFVDQHEGVLYVIGAGLVIGTASVLYITKTGGSALNTALAPLKGQSFQILHIGKLALKADLWDFQPDARVLGAHVVATANWEQVKVDLKFGLLAQGAQMKEAQGQAVVKSGPVTVTATADVKAPTTQGGKPVPQTVNLGLKAEYSSGQLKVGVGVIYADHLTTGTGSVDYKVNKYLSVGATGNAGQRKEGGMQYGGLLTLTINTN
jgi:hypothetical protein